MAGGSKTKKNHAEATSPSLGKAIVWVVLTGMWVLLVASLVSYDSQDPPALNHGVPNETVHNWVGVLGAWLSHKVYLMLGPGVWVLLAGGLTYLVMTAARRPVTQLWLRAVGVIVMAAVVSATAGLLPWALGEGPTQATLTGGLLSVFLSDQLTQRIDIFGAIVVLAVLFVIGAIMSMDQIVFALPLWIWRAITKTAEVMPKPRLSTGSEMVETEEDNELLDHEPQPSFLSKLFGTLVFWRSSKTQGVYTDVDTMDLRPGEGVRAKHEGLDKFDVSEDAGGFAGTESWGMDKQNPVVGDEVDDEDAYEYEYEEVEEDPGVVDSVDTQDAEESEDGNFGGASGGGDSGDEKFDPAVLRERIKKLPINIAQQTKQSTSEIQREPDFSGYQFPSIEHLDMPDDEEDLTREQLVREQAQVLQDAMQTYNIEGEVVGIDSGPTITLYEVALAPGTKVNTVARVSSDIARALKAQNIRIVPNMVGKDTVGIEVPNLKREKVVLRELMTASPEPMQKMKLPMWLGKDASGNPLVHDLHTMPHMLIAGTTGSGKSVCMNAIIMSFLYTKRPDELKLVLVDPKMVEMSMYKDIPHLMCPVVTEMSKAAAILEWAVTKMDERYELLAEAGVRDIKTYNDLGWEEIKERMEPATEEEEARIPKKLPYMVFIIDELADLMMTNKEVEAHIVRIAQKARAVGMHLILATQRPQANVVTGLIKGNMPCRVSFRVASKLDSRIVLDQGGAELLLGHGDMMFLDPKTSKINRSQGTFVDDLEIRRVCKFMKTIATPTFERQLTQLKATDEANVDEEALQDEVFDDAVRVVLDSKRGSVSLLQRRLTIGYGRASRLIEAMAAAGILGDHKGSQAREVLIGLDEWEAMKAQAEKDAAAGTVFENDDDDALDAVDAYQSNKDEGFVPDELEGEYRE